MPLTEEEQLELDILEAELAEEQAATPQVQAPQKPATKYDTSAGGAALSGAGQGITLGYGDEAAAGIGALSDVTEAAIGRRGDIGLKEAYDTRLNQMRNLDQSGAEQHPGAYLGGAVTGGALGVAAAPGLMVPKTFKGAAAVGAVTGYGGGTSRDIGGITRDATIGAGSGVAGKYAGDKLGNLYRSLRGKSQKAAMDALFRRKQRQLQTIKDTGMYNEVAEAVTTPMGDKSLPKDIRRPVVSGVRSPDQMEKAAIAQEDYVLGKLNKARSDIDDYDLAYANPKSVAKKIGEMRGRFSESPEGSKIRAGLKEDQDYFRRQPPMKMGQIAKEKKSYDYKYQPQGGGSKSQNTQNEINKILRDEERAAAERAVNMTAIPEMAENLQQFPANQRRWSALESARKAANLDDVREQANRSNSLTDYMTSLGAGAIAGGGYGASTGDPSGALAVGLLVGLPAAAMHKFIRERGSVMVSSAFRNLANALDNEGFSARYMPALQAAARRGPESLLLYHQAKMKKDPEYKAYTEGTEQ